jgi:hypothetical protein
VTHPLRTIRTIVNEEVLAAFKTVLLPPAQTSGGPVALFPSNPLSPLPIAATMSLEMIGAMPGMLIKRSHPRHG